MVLIISKVKKSATPLSEMFYFMGILSQVATPSEALSKISPIFNSVLIMNPDTLPDKEDYVERLRSYFRLPVFAIKDSADGVDNILFDGIIASNNYASKILNFISNYAESNDCKIPGTYKLAGIDASINLRTPMYFNNAIPLTKTETMILRSLICAYPAPLKAKEILKYAFRPGKMPEEANIRTHISIMNKKFREITGRNLTVLTPSAGYRVLTPEIAEAIIK